MEARTVLAVKVSRKVRSAIGVLEIPDLVREQPRVD